jgi:hypothetical protein
VGDVIDLSENRASPPATPTAPVSDEDFAVIVNGLRSLPPAVRISAITSACADAELGTLVAIIASIFGAEILEHVQFGLEGRE